MNNCNQKTNTPKMDVIYWDNGNIKEINFFNEDGLNHNESGPAYSCFYENGNEHIKHYAINGKWHNLNGASYIVFDKDGKLAFQSYWINDIKINVNYDEEFFRYLKLNNIS